MARRTFWISKSGSVGDATPLETQQAIRRAFSEISDCCDMQFVEKDKESQARIRITFHNNKDMDWNLGLGSTNGRIKLNSERNWPDVIYKHGIEGLTTHEWEHTERIPHSTDRTSIMHPDLPVFHMSPNNVKFLAYKFGSPDKPFHPSARSWAGKAVRKSTELIALNWAEWHDLVAQRTELIAARKWYKNHPLQKTILAIAGPNGRLVELYKLRSKQSADWHTENARWKGVPHVIQL